MKMMNAPASDVTTRGSDVDEELVLDKGLPEDARERKRVLNVLAQRRYRRRKKHKQALLEDMLTKVVNTSNDNTDHAYVTTSLDPIEAPSDGRVSRQLPECNNIQPPRGDSQNSDNQGHLFLNHESVENVSDSWFMEFFSSDSDVADSWPSSDSASLSAVLQVDEVQNTTFSDDYQLAVPELDLLRASFEIASRMNSAERLWDLRAVSVFQDVHCSSPNFDLPANLQPTKIQLSVAHHPILDIIPWPSVRDKLIQMYNMPANFWPRHPDDGSECSIIRLVYDMEAGGIRIWGDDPASDESWEIEEPLFAAWWWALDGKILLATNRRRAARGQRPLQELTIKKTAYTLS